MPQTSAAHPLYLYVVFVACVAVTLALIAAPVVTDLVRRRRERRPAVPAGWTPPLTLTPLTSGPLTPALIAYPAPAPAPDPAQPTANLADSSRHLTRDRSGLVRHVQQKRTHEHTHEHEHEHGHEHRRDVAGATQRLRRRVSA